MAHHADLFVHEALHEVHALVSAFELDCFRAAFLNESQRVSHRVVIARVESSVRHVCDEQSSLHSAAHRFQMDENLLECHRHGVAVSEDDVAEAVADQDDVDSGFINNASGRVIVGCQTNESFATLFT